MRQGSTLAMMEASQDANLRVVGGGDIDDARGFGWRADEGVDFGGVRKVLCSILSHVGR